VLSKRLRTERPERARTSGCTVQPRRSTDALVIKKSTGSKKRPVKPDEPEELPEGNFGEMSVELWREFRLRDPYRFKKRTYTGETSCSGQEGRRQCGMSTILTRPTSRGVGLCINMHSTWVTSTTTFRMIFATLVSAWGTLVCLS
jgi:hypothetical protein